MKGFAVVEVILLVWLASLIGYGVHKGVIEIVDTPPVVNCPDYCR